MELLAPKEDIVFQTLFQRGNEKIAKSLIEDITNQEIKNITLNTDKNVFKRYAKEKSGRLDFKAVLDEGRTCNIEVQLKDNDYDEKRFISYWARNYTEQLDIGKDYKDIKKNITIVILDYNSKITSKMKEIVTKWRIIEDKYRKRILTDDFEFYIIEIPKARKMLEKNPNDRIAQWMMFFDNPNGREVPNIMKTNKEIEEAMKKLEEISADEELRRIINMKKWAEYDYNTRMSCAREEGLAKGIKEGRQRGRKEGRKEGIKAGQRGKQIEIAENMLKEKIDIELICKVTGLTKAEIEGKIRKK